MTTQATHKTDAKSEPVALVPPELDKALSPAATFPPEPFKGQLRSFLESVQTKTGTDKEKAAEFGTLVNSFLAFLRQIAPHHLQAVALVALLCFGTLARAQCPGGICPPGYGGYSVPQSYSLPPTQYGGCVGASSYAYNGQYSVPQYFPQYAPQFSAPQFYSAPPVTYAYTQPYFIAPQVREYRSFEPYYGRHFDFDAGLSFHRNR